MLCMLSKPNEGNCRNNKEKVVFACEFLMPEQNCLFARENVFNFLFKSTHIEKGIIGVVWKLNNK